MHKWYILEIVAGIKKIGAIGLPLFKQGSVLLLEKDGKIFEKYIENYNGKSFKIEGDMVFPSADTSEKFIEFRKKYPPLIREVTEGEAFALML